MQPFVTRLTYQRVTDSLEGIISPHTLFGTGIELYSQIFIENFIETKEHIQLFVVTTPFYTLDYGSATTAKK
jgi:hypothetical protein